VAQAFLALQLAEARYRLADERRHLVAQSAGTPRKHKSDRLVRYLTPLERQRLSILNEEASQAVAAAQRERQNALVDFRSLLALPDGTAVELTAPVLPPEPMALDKYMRVLDTHPALAAVRKEAEAAQAGIALAESERYADPAISLYRERDYYASGRRDVSGIGISVQIPLWNDGGSVVAKARAEAGQAQAQVASVRRDARSRLKRAFVSLQRLVAQAGELHDTLLDTSHEMYLLTRKGFAAGELNVLALVDASNTYFDARARYLELQHQAALAVADLRLASGVSLLDSRKEVQP
jgi:cobalt-zinc-cadmium efflux system outer membrane protein